MCISFNAKSLIYMLSYELLTESILHDVHYVKSIVDNSCVSAY